MLYIWFGNYLVDFFCLIFIGLLSRGSCIIRFAFFSWVVVWFILFVFFLDRVEVLVIEVDGFFSFWEFWVVSFWIGDCILWVGLEGKG